MFDQLVEECKDFFRESEIFMSGHGPEARTLDTCEHVVKARVETVEHVVSLLGEIAQKEIPILDDVTREIIQLKWSDWFLVYRQLVFFAVLSVLNQDKRLVSRSEARHQEFNVD